MSFWVLVQVTVDILVLAGIGFLAVRLSRPAKDDPRMSRGLQLLQSKISVLEDLSDRTETQVTQLTALMDHKIKEIQNIILQSDKQLQQIQMSMGKSLEVAKIFQDKIPHQEIVERQNTIKYVQAARLAHQGIPAGEIAKSVNLSMGEIEFIAKINRDQLQFSEAELPDWAREEATMPGLAPAGGGNFASAAQPAAATISPAAMPAAVEKSMSDLGAQFRNALQSEPQAFQPTTPVQPTAAPVAPEKIVAAPPAKAKPLRTKAPQGEVKKAVFPKIEDLRQR